MCYLRVQIAPMSCASMLLALLLLLLLLFVTVLAMLLVLLLLLLLVFVVCNLLLMLVIFLYWLFFKRIVSSFAVCVFPNRSPRFLPPSLPDAPPPLPRTNASINKRILILQAFLVPPPPTS